MQTRKNNPSFTLLIRPERFSVCRLKPDASIPTWSTCGCWYAITRTDRELSIVCEMENVAPGIKHEDGWRCLSVEGTLDFSLTGIIASLSAPLAEAGISIFAISTFDTDHLLVKENDLAKATRILLAAGFRVQK